MKHPPCGYCEFIRIDTLLQTIQMKVLETKSNSVICIQQAKSPQLPLIATNVNPRQMLYLTEASSISRYLQLWWHNNHTMSKCNQPQASSTTVRSQPRGKLPAPSCRRSSCNPLPPRPSRQSHVHATQSPLIFLDRFNQINTLTPQSTPIRRQTTNTHETAIMHTITLSTTIKRTYCSQWIN